MKQIKTFVANINSGNNLEVTNGYYEPLWKSDLWKKVISKGIFRIDELGLYKCNECQIEVPVIYMNPYSSQTFAFCEECGSILLINIYADFILPNCNCGGHYELGYGLNGTFSSECVIKCLKCNNDKLIITSSSKYKYFQKHSLFELDPNSNDIKQLMQASLIYDANSYKYVHTI